MIPESIAVSPGGSLADRMGIELLELSADKVVGRMPVEGNTQPYGVLHGGASAVLAETLGSIGSAIYAADTGGIALGIELSATHHRSARTGYVTGVATPIHLGRTLATYEIVISDEGGRRICTSRLTCAIRPNPQGG
ncbi:hotdog fold thioesterase [Longispora albida]|uniref:hotdog fold thioesterase n=1 Tax=Longispora albida TaxID=203523 RepID=UPI000370ACBA|nr:hotdog fold thioesterase [Longispora albida]